MNNELNLSGTTSVVVNEGPSVLTMDESSLLARAQAGDTRAFEGLVMPHKRTIYRIALRILRNQEDAEDVVQTTFLDAFRNLSSFQGRSRFSSWLTRIALNAAFMRLRLYRRKPEMSLDQLVEDAEATARFQPMGTDPNPEEKLSAKEARQILSRGFEKLGPLYAEVIHLRDVQELPAKEVARILEVPVGTVKARLHRARTKLTRNVHKMLIPRPNPVVFRNQSAGALMSQEFVGA